MAAPNERQPLLRKADTAFQHVESVSSDADGSTLGESDEEELDEPLDVFLSEHTTPRVRLGLADGVDVMSTTFSRRSSIVSATFSHDDRKALVGHKSRRNSIHTGYGSIEKPERGEILEPKYGYGVTDAQFRWIFLGMLFNWFVASFDSTLMASSHPVITSYFNASSSAAWLSTSFLITSTAFQPMFGRLSDAFGRKLPFIVSMTMFIVGTAFCGLAQSIVQFILARTICGFGAGGALALGVIIITDLIPLQRRASYLAVLNVSFGVGAMLGAALGGFLADVLGWRWEFGIQVPALTICLLITGYNLPSNLGPCLKESEGMTFRQTMAGFDTTGSLVLTVTVTCLILGLNLGGNLLPWTHPFVIGALICFIILSVVFISIEKRVERPIMPLYLLTRHPHTKLIFSHFFVSMTMNSVLFNVPLYFQGVLLDTPTRSGVRLVIPFIFGMVASAIAGYVMNRTQTVMPCMSIGSFVVIIGTIFLTFMPRALPSLAFSFIMATTTVGQGLNLPTYSIGLLSITPANEAAATMSTLFLFRNLGNVLGIAFSSLVVQNALAHYLGIYVRGTDAADIIAQVRQNVELIAHLPLTYREQVVTAYAHTMRWTFGSMVITAALALVIIVSVKLPKLGSAQKQGGHLEV